MCKLYFDETLVAAYFNKTTLKNAFRIVLTHSVAVTIVIDPTIPTMTKALSFCRYNVAH